jgi:hypothetical protein
MTKASITVIQLSSHVALFFILGLTFSQTFGTILKAIWLCLICVFRFVLILSGTEASRFELRVLNGKISGFNNVHLRKESLVAVPSIGSGVATRCYFGVTGSWALSLEVF